MSDQEIKIDKNFIYSTIDELYKQFNFDDTMFHIYAEKKFAIRRVDIVVGLLYGKSGVYVYHNGVRSDIKRPWIFGRVEHNERVKKIRYMRNFIENRVENRRQLALKQDLIKAVRAVVPGVDTEIDKALLEE